MSPNPSQQLAQREMPEQDAPVISSLDHLSNDQIRYIASTEVVPKHLRGRPEAMLAVILKGRSLGFDDIQALDSIDFIDGKATLSGEAMVALVRSKGHSITWELVPGDKCTARGKRLDSGDEAQIVWTVAMAKEAGLWGRGAWKGYPDVMLTWRAVSQLCRFLFADVLRGVSYTPEEATEVAERGHVTETVANLPALEETTIRTEPLSGPSEAQLNRIAALEQRFPDEGYRVVLRGVFGVEMASELHQSAAGEYEAMLEQAAPPQDSAEEPSGAEPVHESVEAGAVDEAGLDASEASSSSVETASGGEPDIEPVSDPPEDLPDEPLEDEQTVIDAEAEELTDERLVELAGETMIPIGTYRNKKSLATIHDSWIEYALGTGAAKLEPFPAFVEALEVWAKARKPELWQKARG